MISIEKYKLRLNDDKKTDQRQEDNTDQRLLNILESEEIKNIE